MNKIELHDPKLDKPNWGDGPWQREPDKIQWIDEATGLDCLMVRGPGGHWCGYVGVGPDHPWHGKDYNASVTDRHTDTCDEDPENGYHYGCTPGGLIEVHGGLTFASGCAEQNKEFGICHVPQDGRPDNVWWFGFDCAHCDDLSPKYRKDYTWRQHGIYRDVAYVQRECAALAKQVRAVTS